MTRASARRLIVLAACGATLWMPAVAEADAGDVIRDCAADGELDRSYPLVDLIGAFLTLPSDVRNYADCEQVIGRAIERAGGPPTSSLPSGTGRLSAASRVKISKRAVRLRRSGLVALRVKCRATRARGTLTLRSGRAGRYTRLGVGRVACAARRGATVRVRISSSNAAALRRRARTRVQAIAVVSNGRGGFGISTARLLIRAR